MIYLIPFVSFPSRLIGIIGNPLFVMSGFPVKLAYCKQAGNDKLCLLCRNFNIISIYSIKLSVKDRK